MDGEGVLNAALRRAGDTVAALLRELALADVRAMEFNAQRDAAQAKLQEMIDAGPARE